MGSGQNVNSLASKLHAKLFSKGCLDELLHMLPALKLQHPARVEEILKSELSTVEETLYY